MRRLGAIAVGALIAMLMASCGAGATKTARRQAATRTPAVVRAAVTSPRVAAVRPVQALVTDEKQNRLLVVDLPSGRIVRRVPLAPDPEDIAAAKVGGVVIAVSSRAGEVTVLDRSTLRPIKTFTGFDEPHIVAISPDGKLAYVTDDARGTLTVIHLSDMKVVSTIVVGQGAHHIALSPDQHQLWIGLSESATEIAVLGSSDPEHPRLLGDFSPGFAAHDLSFNPTGHQIWITSASGPDVTAFDARTRRVLFRVAVGPAPQHLAFAGRYAYVTSGYGSTIEKVDATTGRVIARAPAPYGSFELSAADGYVATASLLRGTLAIYTPDLALLRVVKLAPATREVAVSRP